MPLVVVIAETNSRSQVARKGDTNFRVIIASNYKPAGDPSEVGVDRENLTVLRSARRHGGVR
jgi:hypothetical protein